MALSAFAGYGLYSAQLAEAVDRALAVRQGVLLAVLGAIALGGAGWLAGRVEGHLLARGGLWTAWMRLCQGVGVVLSVIGVLVTLSVFGVANGLGRVFGAGVVDLAEHQVYLLATVAWALLLGYVFNAALWMLPAGLLAGVFGPSGDDEPVPHRGRGLAGVARAAVGHEASWVLSVLGLLEVALGAALGFPKAVGFGLACLGVVLATAAWAMKD